ncbi:hypothetical protein F2P81_011134 [Scophthalmus maximus]|uniref:Uncharacterized protein n=1 Tax=Scophthalmus maximus TaxID=52904 RepID=A0A6A4T0Q6_SCOMX|nr:hypothetical protein F2P81_011134 [Scophthalmus maximus]
MGVRWSVHRSAVLTGRCVDHSSSGQRRIRAKPKKSGKESELEIHTAAPLELLHFGPRRAGREDSRRRTRHACDICALVSCSGGDRQHRRSRHAPLDPVEELLVDHDGRTDAPRRGRRDVSRSNRLAE